MRSRSKATGALGAGFVFACLAALFLLERTRPLRRRSTPGAGALGREARNIAAGLLAGASVMPLEALLVGPATRAVERHSLGLVPRLALPRPLATLLAIVLMDYSQYLWHLLTHRVDRLWRFHEAHHLDRDLSATTGLRFHPGEMLLSMPFRAAQVLAIGVSGDALQLWQLTTLLLVLFQHANVRLPLHVERRLAWLVVTPRMHGIHHSERPAECDSNWGTIFSVFDRLHGTLRLDVPQDRIVIGSPDGSTPGDTSLRSFLVRPFDRDRRSPLRAGRSAVAPRRSRPCPR